MAGVVSDGWMGRRTIAGVSLSEVAVDDLRHGLRTRRYYRLGDSFIQLRDENSNLTNAAHKRNVLL